VRVEIRLSVPHNRNFGFKNKSSFPANGLLGRRARLCDGLYATK
jgi:hypothetical protein